MQTSLTRRQGRRRSNGNGRRGGGGAARRALVAIPLFLFGAMALVAVVGFVVAVSIFLVYSSGNPRVTDLERIQPAAESVIYDREGKVELARFGTERRELVTFEQIPPQLLDATTAVEDKTFWTNTGFDPLGIVAAGLDSLRGDSRGASTITQQLVKQRLLDPKLVQDPDRKVERKVREIIQSIKVTQEYKGDEGKQRIITAYLNQNFYGNNSYGVLSAAKGYFGVSDLSELTLAQAAIIAALPQSPSGYDLVRNAEEQGDGSLVVPPDSKIVQRRNLVLSLMQEGRTPRSGSRFTAADFERAKKEPVVIVAPTAIRWRAAHFVWAVREELVERVCRAGERVTPEDTNVSTCPRIEQGGMKIVTTLDWNLQKNAERWVQASAILPQRKDARAFANSIGVKIAPWMTKIRQNDINNGALVAMDYQTGEIVAYVGSADYYASKSTKKMQAQFDVLGDGYRQPGSAFKPFNYATGINDRTLTAASMFMDVTTDFGGGYTPTNADGLERGPLRVRQALQYSLNIPAIKALATNREERVFEMAEKFGMDFQEGAIPVPSMTLGTLEVLPKDLVQAYATLANGGVKVAQTRIIKITELGNDAQVVYEKPKETQGERIISSQAAYIVTDILQENTDPSKNPIWGIHRITTGKTRRPAALKTGTNNDLKDLNAYGFIAPPTQADRDAGAYALAVGAWNGNSDASVVGSAERPVFSNDVTAYVWENFIEQSSRKWPVRDFRRPDGIAEAEVDAFSGMRPNQFSRRTVTELFIDGTQPDREDTTKRALQVLEAPDGTMFLWKDGCLGTPTTRGFLDLSEVEKNRDRWHQANEDWIARARKGPGTVGGPEKTSTSYFYGSGIFPYGNTWGAPFPPTRSCDEAPSPSPSPSDSPSPSPSESPSASPSETPSGSLPTTPPPTEPPPTAPPPTEPPPTDPPPTDPPPTDPPTPPPTDPPTPKPTKPPTPEPTAPPTDPPPTDPPPTATP